MPRCRSHSGTAGAAGFFSGVPNSHAIRDNITIQKNAVTDIEVLANDIAGAFDFALLSVTTPSSGGAVVAGDKVTYTPAVDFVGTATFEYTSKDATTGAEDTSLVTVTIVDPAIDGTGCTANVECINTCVAGTCTGLGDVGGACDPGDDDDCGPGSAGCDGAGVCGGNGVVCSADTECVNICNGAVCVDDDVPNGEMCDEDTDCVNICDGSVCVDDDIPNGNTCDENTDCLNTCIGGTCADQAGLGGTCDVSDGEDCTSGACDGTGTCVHRHRWRYDWR